MNVLEKILEEIEERKQEHLCNAELEIEETVNRMEELNWVCALIYYMEEVKKANVQTNDDWIPCSKRLPEEHDSIFAIYKDTHLWSKSMFEKVSDPVNITYELEDGTRKTGTSHTLDGKWKIEKENRIVKRKVVAWQPLPNPYKGE